MRIIADLDKITVNARATAKLCAGHGVSVAAVTKSVCGEPAIVRAILAGGITTIAESRLDNVVRIREAGITCDVLLLRLPRLSEVDEVVALATSSLNSEARTLRALSDAALRQGRAHEVILTVEWGDRREGAMPEETLGLCRLALDLPGLELAGVACNLSCLCGVLATPENVGGFASFAEGLERDLGVPFRVVSGGHTTCLQLLDRDCLGRVDQLRVGEGVLFGRDSVCDVPLPGGHTDTFKVYAEVIEVKEKPSAPEGEVGPDAMLRTREWPDRGIRRRAVLAMGEMDLDVTWLAPTSPGIELVGASSDHTVMDVTDAEVPVEVGDELEFLAHYVAVARAWASRGTRRGFVSSYTAGGPPRGTP